LKGKGERKNGTEGEKPYGTSGNLLLGEALVKGALGLGDEDVMTVDGVDSPRIEGRG